MDQEKRIRISADISQLREMRQELDEVGRSLDDLNKTHPTIDFDPKTFDFESFDRSMRDIRDKLKKYQDWSPFEGDTNQNPPRETVEETQPENRLTPDTNPNPPREEVIVERRVENINEQGSSQLAEQLSVLRQIFEAVASISDISSESASYLETLIQQGSPSNVPPVIPPAVPPTTTILVPPAQQPPERRQEQSSSNWSGSKEILAQLIRGAIQSYGAVANSRNTYEAGASEIGAVGQTVGALTSATGKVAGGLAAGIPVVGPAIQSVASGAGDLIGSAISGITSVVSSYAHRAVAKAEELENNVRPFSQTTGIDSFSAKSQALREGSYAAADLGMNAGEYLGRRGQLIRAAGGKILGNSEEDPTGRREAESQMAVQRLYGLDNGSVDQLQSTLRFATRGSEEFGTSGNSPSGVIRLFENTMRELKLPFSEIASTLDESLQTFNKTAEQILDKAGEFDAGKVATMLSNIRSFTGMEGRQLERVQTAITGGSISQDDVTQALLMRVGRDVFPEAGSLSELMEKLDKIGQEPELQQAFIERLDSMTDTDEQLKQLMKAVFTNLHWEDIRKFIDSAREQGDYDKLFKRGGIDPEVAAGNEGDVQYNRSVGRRTVGAIESATAEKTNRDAANGEKMLGVLASIDSKIVQIATDSNLIETTTKKTNDFLDAIAKLLGLTAESKNLEELKKNHPQYYKAYQAQWGEYTPGAVIMDLLKKVGVY